MLFKVENSATGRITHCGVLEFVAEEGVVYMPHWVRATQLPHAHHHVMHPNVRASVPTSTSPGAAVCCSADDAKHAVATRGHGEIQERVAAQGHVRQAAAGHL